MEKIKPLIKHWIESDTGKDVLVIIIIILVGLGSFELGRLSKDNANSGIKIEYSDQEANILGSIDQNSTDLSPNPDILQNSQKLILGNFFASKRGTKYYSLGCSAGKTIKQENRIYFATSTEAQNAGYELSSSCR